MHKSSKKHVSTGGSNTLLAAGAVNERERKLVDKWIKELSDAGYTPDDMIAIFREARRKYDDYKQRKNKTNGRLRN